jgi:hypothetical protein
MAEIRRKLVIVGDGACGKTCLLMYVLAPAPLDDGDAFAALSSC